MNCKAARSHPSSTFLYAVIVLMVLPWLLSGCGAVIVAGAGAGTYSYLSGNITRTYSAGYQQTVNACLNVLNRMEINIVKKSGDALKTRIESKRYDSTDITVEIEQLGSRLSRVNIRTGLMGVDKKSDSEMLHEYISDELEKPLLVTNTKVLKPSVVNTLSPESYKVEVSPGFAESAESFNREQDSGGYQAEENNNSITEPLQSTFQIKPPQNPLYIFYKDKEVDIPQSALVKIDAIASFLRNSPSSTIDIKSYTDSHGTAEDNLDLSWKRANVIKNYFTQNGISYERITTRGYGASHFLESNRTEALRKMNRRAVLHIQP
jgi:outer membrane protein OmpA-like peptidoglycan-associated protein